MLTVTCPHCGAEVSLDASRACCRDWLADMRKVRSPHALLVLVTAVEELRAKPKRGRPKKRAEPEAPAEAAPEQPSMVDLG